MAGPPETHDAGLPNRLPSLIPASVPGQGRDPRDALRLVREAADTIHALQNDKALAEAWTHEIVAQVRNERLQSDAEIQALRRLAQAWQQRAHDREAELMEANLVVWNERIQRAQAETLAGQATRRAEQAERRARKLESLLGAIADRLGSQP